MTKILLSGASGFIGRQILNELLQNDSFQIVAIKHHQEINIIHPRLKIIQSNIGNITINKLPFVPDVVIHAARNSTGKFGDFGRRFMAIKGRKENQKLLELLHALPQLPKIIYCSGSLMYGNYPEQKVDETFEDKPISFAREYYRAELPIKNLIENNTENVIMLRLPWVIGDGSWLKWNYIGFMEKHRQVPLYGDGNNLMSFVDVRFVAKVISFLIHQEFSGLLNLFHPQSLTQKKWAELISKKVGLPIQQLTNSDFEILPNAVREAFSTNIELTSIHHKLQEKTSAFQISIEESVRYYLSSMFKDK